MTTLTALNAIRHEFESRDSLYHELSSNLEIVRDLWLEGVNQLRFSIPILCAAKLEAFINVAGKINVADWDTQERRLSFEKKCQIICDGLAIGFNATKDPNCTVLEIFNLRNELVHPKMLLEIADEQISKVEYHRRQTALLGVEHSLRSSLDKERIIHLLKCTDEFVALWGYTFLRGSSKYWLSWGATGRYTTGPEYEG